MNNYTLERKLRSFFDHRIGGTPTALGYVIIMRDMTTKETYGILKEDFYEQLSKGESLTEADGTKDFGEGLVRAMTFREELAWNQGEYDDAPIVDIWGNIKEVQNDSY